MSHEIPLESLLFGVEQVPIEAVGPERRILVLGKKALLNAATGKVLGVVSRDYQVVTNQEAVEIAREVCAKAFPGIAPLEWETKRASAPSTLSYAFIDLMHRTYVLNYTGNQGDEADPFTPFLRVTNSFNGARALRFDIGFLRQHISAERQREPDDDCDQPDAEAEPKPEEPQRPPTKHHLRDCQQNAREKPNQCPRPEMERGPPQNLDERGKT